MFDLMKRRKFCLVLGGGGAKGAYQIGAWKAIREEHIELEAIIGTSIGAINGALMTTCSYETVLNTWLNLQLNQIFKFNSSEEDTLARIKDVTKQLITFGGVDTTPLRNFINRLVDENKLRKSETNFGLVSFKLKELKPIEYFKEDIPKGQLTDYLMASSCLPGFKPANIEGDRFADGGFYDVVPYNTARKRGYTNIIAIDVSGVGIDQKDKTEGGITYFIKNSQDTGGVVDFNPEGIKRNIRLGYLDARKTFGYFDSKDYFFSLPRSAKRKFNQVLQDVNFVNHIRQMARALKLSTDCTLEQQIRSMLPSEMRLYKDLFVVLIECAADLLCIDVLLHDNYQDLLCEIKNRFIELKNKNTNSNNNNFFDRLRFTSSVINSALYNSPDLVRYITCNQNGMKYLKLFSTINSKLCGGLILLKMIDLL